MQQNETLYTTKNKREFTKEQINEMYRLFHIKGMLAKDISTKFNVSRDTLSEIVTHKLYLQKIDPELVRYVKENGSVNNKSKFKKNES